MGDRETERARGSWVSEGLGAGEGQKAPASRDSDVPRAGARGAGTGKRPGVAEQGRGALTVRDWRGDEEQGSGHRVRGQPGVGARGLGDSQGLGVRERGLGAARSRE